MDTLTVKLDLPRDLVGALDVSEAQVAGRLRELIAVELFRQGRISCGKGAELLGVPKWEFVQVLVRDGCNYFTEAPEELGAEVATLERLLADEGAA